MKKVIIITGGIASGKSYLLAVMDQLGYPTMKSDEVAKEIMSGSWFVDKMKSILGKEDFNLKAEIEADPKVLDIVEDLIHPKMEPVRKRFIEESHKKNSIPVIEIPLFFEKNIREKLLNYDLEVISAICGKDIQIQRARNRKTPISDTLLNLIISRQISDEERVARSKFVIYTSLKKSVVKKQLINVLRGIQ